MKQNDSCRVHASKMDTYTNRLNKIKVHKESNKINNKYIWNILDFLQNEVTACVSQG